MRELDIRLDRASPVPLYYQLAQAIEQAIVGGELAPGDRLENELALTGRLGLSRPTARQAIQELVNKGLLVRKRGVGTQVVRPRFSRDERLSSLHDDLLAAGRQPSSQLLDFGEVIVDGTLADTLTTAGIDVSQPLLRIRRLRLADDQPLAILTNHLPLRYGLTEDDLAGEGLYSCLRARGVNLRIAHQRASARLLTDDEAALFDVDTPAATMTVDRIAYDDLGQFVEFGRHIYRTPPYALQTTLVV